MKNESDSLEGEPQVFSLNLCFLKHTKLLQAATRVELAGG